MKFPRPKPVVEMTTLPLAIDEALRALAGAGEQASRTRVTTLQDLIRETDPDQGVIGAILWDLAYDLEYVLADAIYRPTRAADLATQALGQIEQRLARRTGGDG